VSWWQDWLHRRPSFSAAQSARIDGWQRLPAVDPDVSFDATRWCVVDVETSGLDVRRDSLIAIGAVTIESRHVVMGNAFYRLLRQENVSSVANILVHRITGTAQREGEDPAEALLAFLEWIGHAPLIGFHAPFDATMLRRAVRSVLGVQWRHRWLDLAELLPVVFPDTRPRDRSLDDWLTRFNIVVQQRHNALADALATAQLLQVCMERAKTLGMRKSSELFALAAGRRWLGGEGVR
jgi:DNA polymerase III subunit epsilon